MLKAIRGERTATFGVLLGLAAVICVAVGLLFFILDLRHTANAAVKAEQNLRATIQTRCAQRVNYDQRFVTKVKSDVQKDTASARTWQQLYDATKDIPIAPNTPAAVVAAYRKQQRIIQAAADSALKSAADGQKIVDQGVIGGCSVYNAH